MRRFARNLVLHLANPVRLGAIACSLGLFLTSALLGLRHDPRSPAFLVAAVLFGLFWQVGEMLHDDELADRERAEQARLYRQIASANGGNAGA